MYLAAVVILAGGALLYLRAHKAATPTAQTAANNAPSTISAGGVTVDTNGNGSVELVSIQDTKITPPSLDRPLVVTTQMSPDAAAAVKADLQKYTDQLKAAPTRVDLWLKLGVYRKMAGDYVGAEQAWSYVAAAAPKSISYIAYGNLGDLHQNFLKDYPKAEAEYKQAIALNPTVVFYYRDLYTLYRYQYKTDTSAAADILAQGLKANPGNQDLLTLQAQLQAGK